MRDDLQGGLLATLIAAPAVMVCCGGGGILLSAMTGVLAGWFSGLGGLATVLAAAVAALTVRSMRPACPVPASGDTKAEERVHG